MQYKINVPRFDWLIGGSRIGSDYNRYYGSLGTDPLKGCIGQKIFNYSVWMEKREAEGEEPKELILAGVYYGTKSFKNTNPDEIVIEEFPAEEESLEKVGLWLDEQAKQYLE